MIFSLLGPTKLQNTSSLHLVEGWSVECWFLFEQCELVHTISFVILFWFVIQGSFTHQQFPLVCRVNTAQLRNSDHPCHPINAVWSQRSSFVLHRNTFLILVVPPTLSIICSANTHIHTCTCVETLNALIFPTVLIHRYKWALTHYCHNALPDMAPVSCWVFQILISPVSFLSN